MNTFKIKTIFDESLFKIPNLISLKGKEVEITIKNKTPKTKHIVQKNIKEAQDLISKYIPKNAKLSDELISERRKEFELE
jgi:hypothetical protein